MPFISVLNCIINQPQITITRVLDSAQLGFIYIIQLLILPSGKIDHIQPHIFMFFFAHYLFSLDNKTSVF